MLTEKQKEFEQEIVVEYLSKEKSLLKSTIEKVGDQKHLKEYLWRWRLYQNLLSGACSVEDHNLLWDDVGIFQNKSLSDMGNELKKGFRIPIQAEIVRLMYEEIIPVESETIVVDSDNSLVSFSLSGSIDIIRELIENKKDKPLFSSENTVFGNHWEGEIVSEKLRKMSSEGNWWYINNKTKVSHLVLLKDR